ncbi:MAG: lysophospholipid acyltransferase family protein [Magnetospiraceae bacterium]
MQNTITFSRADDPWFRRGVMRSVEILTGQKRLQRLYDRYLSTRQPNDIFWQSAIDYLRLTVRYDPARLANIPKTGPLIVVANHPFGVLDGLAIGYLVHQVRTDFKVLANAVLGRAEVFRPYLIPIEFDGLSSALRSNVMAKRETLAHLRTGGAIIVFPAGGVSTAQSPFGPATDAPWKLFTGKLIEASGATVVPIYFEGQNGPLFHFVSKFSQALREALILREVAKKINDEIVAHVGQPVPHETLMALPTRQALLDFLRTQVYHLGTPQPA